MSALHHRRRRLLLERDGSACWFCGLDLGGDRTLEHLIARSVVGHDPQFARPRFMRLAHAVCNSRAGAMSLAQKGLFRDLLHAIGARLPAGRSVPKATLALAAKIARNLEPIRPHGQPPATVHDLLRRLHREYSMANLHPTAAQLINAELWLIEREPAPDHGGWDAWQAALAAVRLQLDRQKCDMPPRVTVGHSSSGIDRAALTR